MPWNPVMVRQQWLVNLNDMNIHKVTTSSYCKSHVILIMISKVHSQNMTYQKETS